MTRNRLIEAMRLASDPNNLHPDMILSETTKADIAATQWIGTPSYIAPNLIRYVPDLGIGGDFRGMEPVDQYSVTENGEWYRAEDVDALFAKLIEDTKE